MLYADRWMMCRYVFGDKEKGIWNEHWFCELIMMEFPIWESGQ